MHPEPADPAAAVIELLQSFSLEADRFVGVFADAHGLHRTDLNAIAHIWRASRLGDPLTPKSLAALLTLSPPATTALLDRLERGGYVVRTPDTVDRRRVYLHGRGSAQEIAAAFFVPLGRTLHAVAERYDAAELAVVRGFLAEAVAATTAMADRVSGGPPAPRR